MRGAARSSHQNAFDPQARRALVQPTRLGVCRHGPTPFTLRLASGWGQRRPTRWRTVPVPTSGTCGAVQSYPAVAWAKRRCRRNRKTVAFLHPSVHLQARGAVACDGLPPACFSPSHSKHGVTALLHDPCGWPPAHGRGGSLSRAGSVDSRDTDSRSQGLTTQPDHGPTTRPWRTQRARAFFSGESQCSYDNVSQFQVH